MVFYKVVERDNPSTLKDFMGENSSHPHVMEKRKINIILEACIDCILTETKLEGAWGGHAPSNQFLDIPYMYMVFIFLVIAVILHYGPS